MYKAATARHWKKQMDLKSLYAARKMEEGSENPVSTWRKRSRQAIESLPSAPLQPQSRQGTWIRGVRLFSPLWLIASRLRIERVGLDLICNSCQQHISKSQKLMISCHFYRSDPSYDLWGCPLTRCFVRCPNPNCNNGLRLGRNVGNSDSFIVISGATQHFPPEDTLLNTDNEFDGAYPDALLDSPNDTDGKAVEVQSLAAGVQTLAAAYNMMLHQKGRLRSIPILDYRSNFCNQFDKFSIS